MAKGHRSQIKRERNAQKDTRPSAKLSYARVSVQKACFVLDAIRGKDVETALGIVMYNPRYASTLVEKLLKSAIANAENNNGMNRDNLYVAECYANKGPYLEYGNPESLEYWEYDKLGQEASLGCIRLTVKDAKWIFDNCNAGTKVEFYSSDNPGPLGKPEIEKISQNEELRNWDPTDEKEQNPWIPYLEERKNKIEELNKVIKTIQKVSKIMKI